MERLWFLHYNAAFLCRWIPTFRKTILLPSALLQRRKQAKGGEVSRCNATTEGSDVCSSSQQEVHRRYVWLVGILRQGVWVSRWRKTRQRCRYATTAQRVMWRQTSCWKLVPTFRTLKLVNSIYFYDFSCLSFLRDYVTAVLLSPSPLSERTEFCKWLGELRIYTSIKRSLLQL
jgi:hypothetical protein